MGEPEKTQPIYKQPHFWAAIATIGSLIGMTCPLWPAPYSAACHLASQGLQKGSEVGRQVSGAGPSSPSSSSPAPEPSSGTCKPGAVQSVPNFCKCAADGTWRDYFDAGTPCGG